MYICMLLSMGHVWGGNSYSILRNIPKATNPLGERNYAIREELNPTRPLMRMVMSSDDHKKHSYVNGISLTWKV